MERLFIFALLMTAATANIKAQEIYDYLLDKSEQVINNPESKDFDLKIAQFKATAMRYFRKKIILQEGSVSSTWLDEQALALNEFVTNYLVELSQNSNGSNQAFLSRPHRAYIHDVADHAGERVVDRHNLHLARLDF